MIFAELKIAELSTKYNCRERSLSKMTIEAK